MRKVDQGISCESSRKMNFLNLGSVKNFSDLPGTDLSSSNKSLRSTIESYDKGDATVPIEDITRTPVEPKESFHRHSHAFPKGAAVTKDSLCESVPLGSAVIHSEKALLSGVAHDDSGLKLKDSKSQSIQSIHSFVQYSGLGNSTARCAWSGNHCTRDAHTLNRSVSLNILIPTADFTGNKLSWPHYGSPDIAMGIMDIESVAAPVKNEVQNTLTRKESYKRRLPPFTSVRQHDVCDEAEKISNKNHTHTERLIDTSDGVPDEKQAMLSELAKETEKIEATKGLFIDGETESPKWESTFMTKLQGNRLDKSALMQDVYNPENQLESDGSNTEGRRSPGVSSKGLSRFPIVRAMCDGLDDVCTQKRLGKEAFCGNNSKIPAVLSRMKIETDELSLSLQRSLLMHPSDTVPDLSYAAVVPMCSAGKKKRGKAKEKNAPSITEEQFTIPEILFADPLNENFK